MRSWLVLPEINWSQLISSVLKTCCTLQCLVVPCSPKHQAWDLGKCQVLLALLEGVGEWDQGLATSNNIWLGVQNQGAATSDNIWLCYNNPTACLVWLIYMRGMARYGPMYLLSMMSGRQLTVDGGRLPKNSGWLLVDMGWSMENTGWLTIRW
jgi:hypothetical protein